tara:strand:- start:82 stop:489 length:408 start_codon:yes stop_codon:yes gene_type:complete
MILKLGASITFAAIILYLIKISKAGHSIGHDLSKVYTLILIFFSSLYFYLNKRTGRLLKQYNYTLIFIVIITTLSALMLQSTSSERIALACFIIIYPLAAKTPEAFKQKKLLQFLFILLGFFPLFLSDAKLFLQN